MERNDELQARWGQAAIDALDQAVGKITRVECYADGIYYIGAHKEDSASCFAAEYYVVENDTKIISAQAKAYGTPIEGCSDLLLFQAEVEGKGFKIIEFELARYRVANHIPLDPLESPYDIALFAAEDYPDYFGPYPAPTVTPFGNLLRYISLENGIIWMETDGEGWALALSYPIWASDLTPLAIALGKQTERDAALGIEKTMGYLFFSERDSCIPLFELLVDHPALQKAAMDHTFARIHSQPSEGRVLQAPGLDELGHALLHIAAGQPLRSLTDSLHGGHHDLIVAHGIHPGDLEPFVLLLGLLLGLPLRFPLCLSGLINR